MNGQSNVWLALQNPNEALKAINAAVVIHRGFASKTSYLALSLHNQGMVLNALNRPRDALYSIIEALKIYKYLALTEADNYMSELAISYGVLGQIFMAHKQYKQAYQSFRKGLQIITPYVTHLPKAFGSQTKELIFYHHESAKAANLEPDTELLNPLIAVLEKL